MEIACEVGAELELQQNTETPTQQRQGFVTGIVPKHYKFQEDSSEEEEEEEEEEDLIPEQVFSAGNGDCVCCVCGENFTFLNNLIEHFNLHKHEVRCHLCQVTFTRVISLALHLENAHPKYHLFCKSCKVMFQNKWDMNQHMEKHFRRFRNCKVVRAQKGSKPTCSVKQKPLDKDVRGIIIKNLEVEMKYLKEEDHILYTVFSDHNYCDTQSLTTKLSISDDAPAHKTHISTKSSANNVKSINNEPLNVSNSKVGSKDMKESEGNQQGKVEVVLRSMPQKEGVTKSCTTILQATYEKLLKSQKTEKNSQKTEQETTPKASISFFTTVVEPVKLECDIKAEESATMEDLIQEDEDNIQIKNESDTNKKPINTVKVCVHPDTKSSNEKPLSSGKVRTGIESSPSNQNPLSSKKVNVGPEPSTFKNLQICNSCGLSKAFSTENPPEKCKCKQTFPCSVCGLKCASDQVLLKHLSESHLITQYVSSNCLQVCPKQNSFIKHPSVTKLSVGQSASNVKSSSKMILKFVPSSAVGASCKSSLKNGGRNVSSLNIIYSNNVINVLDTRQKLGTVSNSTTPMMSRNPSSTVSGQVNANITLNTNQERTSIVFKGGEDPAALAIRAKTGQMQMVIPGSSSASIRPTEAVFRGVPLTHQRQVLTTNSSSGTSAPASNQSKVALRIPTYPSTAKVKVSFSPTPIQFPTPTHFSTSSVSALTSRSHRHVRPLTIPLCTPVTVPSGASTLANLAAPVHPCVNLQGPPNASSPLQASPPSEGPLRIVAMFVNQSQELALQKRLRQSWRSKAIFSCRHCGAIARQPAMGIRHRYQHRGPRLHRCQCGRTFEQQLHLLRHQVQHAEATRYVCAACGQTFQGTHRLACHKQRVIFRVIPSRTIKNATQECRNAFPCDCGQAFTRSSALLWHKLKNSRTYKCLKKLC